MNAKKYVENKVTKWIDDVNHFLKVAAEEFLIVISAFTKDISHLWYFI